MIAVLTLTLALALGAPPPLAVEGAWLRTPPASRDLTAAYLTLRNDGPRPLRVTGAACAIADTVELHDMTVKDGIMEMRPVRSIVVPARSRVELRPGGLHLMLFGLGRRLRPGETVPLRLAVAGADSVTVAARVGARGPRPAAGSAR